MPRSVRNETSRRNVPRAVLIPFRRRAPEHPNRLGFHGPHRKYFVPNVHFTSTASGSSNLDMAALALADTCREALGSSGRFRPCPEPDDADFIVFIEPPRHKFHGYGLALAEHPIIQRFPQRCFAYDWADGPAGFLPGVYPSLRRSQWNPGRLVSGGFLLPYNELIGGERSLCDYSSDAPDFLISFRGAASHPVRLAIARILEQLNYPDMRYSLGGEWFNHDLAQKHDHIERVLSAKFSLCPRGVGAATFRVYESMALGRAPVIISDDWLAPEGPDWPHCSLVISESRLTELPQLIRDREPDWADMGRTARQEWDAHFAPSVAVTRVLEAIERITLARPRGESLEELTARWTSTPFKRENGWTRAQRLRRLMTSSQARTRMRHRILTPPSKGTSPI